MTYLSRTLTAGILLPVFVLIYNLHSGNPIGFAGPYILTTLSTLMFIESMLAGLRYTSDCISEERREGTLGLLFLTNLNGLDIVLGKLFARGLRAFYSLIAGLPILSLTIFLGGVTGQQIFAISLTLVVCVLFSLAAGVFISSRGYRERNVLAGMLLFLVAITVAPLAVNMVAVRIFGFYGFVDTLVLLSPYNAFNEAAKGFGARLSPALWTLLLSSLVFLIYAAWRTRRTFGEPEPSMTLDLKPASFRRRIRRKSIPKGPFEWLAQRGRISSSKVVALAAFIVCFGMFSNVAVSNRWNWAIPVVFLSTYGLHAIYKFLLTAEACQQLNEDRRNGALELLLVTPASTGHLVHSVLKANWRKWIPVLFALGFLNYTWMSSRTFAHDRAMQVMLPISLVLLVSDTILLPYRALLRALHGERYTLTVFKTFVRTQGPPLALIAFMLGMSIGSNSENIVHNCFVGWVLICLVYTAVLLRDARKRLRLDFRKLAAGESVSPPWHRRRFPVLSLGEFNAAREAA